ncbi:tyrosine-type recombinase/integrase [Flavobacteriaceae bacterium F08102]|nr:tyrosine-type recombinase/integrase [Flavobacteriaceae bacterium F08102]
MLIPKFLDYLSLEKKYSPHTVCAYENDLLSFKEFCEEEFGIKELSEIQYQQVRSWIVNLVQSGISNRSINRKISSLKSFYSFLVRIQYIQHSPLVKHKALKVAQRVQVPFSVEELVKVLEVFSEADDFDGVRNKLVVELLYSTGMRRAELIDLRLSSIDLSNEVVKIKGKRNKERYVPLLPSVQTTIKTYLELREKLSTKGDHFFVTAKGNKLYATLVYRIINEYFSKVSTKVKKSPHVIRHSFATHLLNEGADLNSVKELLGHSSLASTQVYTHSSLNELKKVYNQAHPRSDKNKCV